METLNHQEGGDHYKTLGIQPWEIIEKNNLDYFRGNIIKSLEELWCPPNILRHKDVYQELKKARYYHYIDYLIEREEKKI